MPKKTSPPEALALLNKAIANAIDQLHQLQGARKAGSLHLMVKTRHKPACTGCPHYQWVIWQPQRATRGPGIGEMFPNAHPCKAPTRSNAAKNPKVMEMVVLLIKLLDQRSKLVDAISRADRSAHATFKLLEPYIA